MDTSTGEIYYGNDAVKKAFDSGKIKDMDALVELPTDIAQELIGMNRQGRRAWWKQNRKKLNLPRWNERQSITPHQTEDYKSN